MAAKKKTTSHAVEIINKRASYEYQIVEKYEAGIALLGTEIKSIRQRKVNLNDAYCFFKGNELYVKNMHIAEYEYGGAFNHDPRRLRKLLLHRHELRRLQTKVKEKGFTIVPLRLYINERGIAKLEIALVTGKKKYDKKTAIKERDIAREMERELKRWR